LNNLPWQHFGRYLLADISVLAANAISLVIKEKDRSQSKQNID